MSHVSGRNHRKSSLSRRQYEHSSTVVLTLGDKKSMPVMGTENRGCIIRSESAFGLEGQVDRAHSVVICL